MATLPFIPVPTSALAAELAQLPATLRAQMLFSARLEVIRPLLAIGDSVGKILEGDKSLSESRRDIRKALAEAGYQKSGDGLLDHTSAERLNLILQQNVRAARGYTKRMADMDPDVLDVFPAQELVRVYRRKVERDWKNRWAMAGGTFSEGRMIALKTAPIWMSLSRFGVPWPPFDYNSGMGVADVTRAETERLGLIEPEAVQTPEIEPYSFESEAELPGIEGLPKLKQAILDVMGKAAKFDGNVLRLDPAVAAGAARLGLAGEPAVSAIRAAEATNLIKTRQAAVRDPEGHLLRFEDNLITDRQPGTNLEDIRAAFEAIRKPDAMEDKDGFRFYTKKIGNVNTTVQTRLGKVVRYWVGTKRGGTQ